MKFYLNAGIIVATATIISGCTPVGTQTTQNRTLLPSTGNLRLADTGAAEQSTSESIAGAFIPSN